MDAEPIDNGRAERIAAVEREFAELAAVAAPVPAGPGGPRRRGAGERARSSSVVISMRLAPNEARALERRAAASGLSASALARAYVRRQVCAPPADDALAGAVTQLETAVAELRAMVP